MRTSSSRPAGSPPTGRAWLTPAHPRFLVPGYALSAIFRANMQRAFGRAGLAAAVDARVWRRRWTVHVQQIGTGAQATLYLSRYVYRVGLTNQRLTRFTDGRVTFRYTHAATHEARSVTLPVDSFLTRFLQHILPRGLTKIRWYGLLSPGRRPALERARQLLARHSSPPMRRSVAPDGELPSTATTIRSPDASSPPCTRALRCPVCKRGPCVLVQRYSRDGRSRAPP